MFLPTLLTLLVLCSPAGTPEPRGAFDSVVPLLPGGYASGRVSIHVYSVPMPQATPTELVGDLVARTGMPITESHGVRIQLTLPDDLRFESMEARVVDGLVLRPQGRSFIGRVGNALVSVLRLLFVGRLISATDELVVSGAVWAAALGSPDVADEVVRISTSEFLSLKRDAPTFSDHGNYVVLRSMLALSPWTELVDIQLTCFDRVSGKQVGFLIPRLSLHGEEEPESAPTRTTSSRVAMADL